MGRVRNIYFLIAGLFFWLFALGHAAFGAEHVLGFSMASALDISVKTAIFYSWHTPTVENVIFGVFFMFMAFVNDQRRMTVAAELIFVVTVGRLLVYLGSNFYLNPQGVASVVPTIVIMIFIFGLLLMGIRKSRTATI